jgi:hypothetical protein
MYQIWYILICSIKRQEAVDGRVFGGPDIIGSGDLVGVHIFPDQGIVPLSGGYAEGVVV